MFSVKEKQEIAQLIEDHLIKLNHPEMPKERPSFNLHVRGAESWSWAEITPNWKYSKENPPDINPWNEKAREALASEGDQD